MILTPEQIEARARVQTQLDAIKRDAEASEQAAAWLVTHARLRRKAWFKLYGQQRLLLTGHASQAEADADAQLIYWDGEGENE